MMNVLHHVEIVWRRQQAEQEFEAELRRRVLERVAAEPRESRTALAWARLVRRVARVARVARVKPARRHA